MIFATIGGVTVGICILLWTITEWWPGVKALQKRPQTHAAKLLPFLVAWAYGALVILTAMGLIGWAGDTLLWASNWLGDAALWLGVGETPGQASRGVYVPLTVFGNCLVLIATVAIVAAVKFTPAGPGIKRGVWCGVCLGTSSSVAGLVAVPLAEGANALGSWVYTVAA